MSWHDYIALSIVAACAAYIGYRVWRAIFGTATESCASACGSCGHSAKTNATELLTIGPAQSDIRQQ